MPWTTPTDRLSGYTVTAADWNIVEDDLAFLYGDLAWTNVATFTGTWVNSSGNARYRLVGTVVYMQGLIASGTINTAAFTLPVGYRPTASILRLAVPSSSAFGQLSITNTGIVTPNIGSTTAFSLDVSFSVI